MLFLCLLVPSCVARIPALMSLTIVVDAYWLPVVGCSHHCHCYFAISLVLLDSCYYCSLVFLLSLGWGSQLGLFPVSVVLWSSPFELR